MPDEYDAWLSDSSEEEEPRYKVSANDWEEYQKDLDRKKACMETVGKTVVLKLGLHFKHSGPDNPKGELFHVYLSDLIYLF